MCCEFDPLHETIITKESNSAFTVINVYKQISKWLQEKNFLISTHFSQPHKNNDEQ
jgi:hypothetical protein